MLYLHQDSRVIDMITLMILAVACGLVGIVGSIIPGIPGPPISWIGLLLAFFYRRGMGQMDRLTFLCLMVWLAITVIVTVLDYVIPAKFTKLTGGSKASSTGALVGLFAGMFIPPVGMILGSLLGAFLAEMLVAGKDVWQSMRASAGAFLGFLCGTGIKIIASGVMLYYIFA